MRIILRTTLPKSFGNEGGRHIIVAREITLHSLDKHNPVTTMFTTAQRWERYVSLADSED